MSRWIDKAARRLAISADRSAASTVELESDSGLTRRQAVGVAAGAGLALGVMSFGPSTGRANADNYCFPSCLHDAENKLANANDRTRAGALHLSPAILLAPAAIGLGGRIAYNVVSQYSDYYDDRAACREINCGNPTRFPPPPTPPPVKPPGCDPGYLLCGDYCCDTNLAYCQGCSAGPTCCRNGANCCPNG